MSLANYQYDAIMRDYNRKQFANKRIADRRYEEVCKTIPAFAALAQEESAVTLRYGEQMLHGASDASEALSEALRHIDEQKSLVLVQHGYPADYLDTPCSCPKCHDTGYIDDVTPCSCFRKAAVALLYDQSARQDIYKRENFKTFSLDYYSDTRIDPVSGKTMRQQAKEALLICRRFAEELDQKHGNLILYGPTGVGKTFLANSIAKYLIDTIHSVVHLDAPAFFKALADDHFRSKEDDGSAAGFSACDCLIVDDLGAELLNSFVVSSLCECIEYRRLHGKSTVFTTNLGPAELKAQYQDRVFSRLIADYTFLHLDGDDIRLLIKTKTIHTGTGKR